MGFALFESSGTFNPANYGLVIGDMIQVVAVGGGKGGQGVSNNGHVDGGANGLASSFGSYVTAAGANTHVDTAGVSSTDSGISRSLGSDGEHGWGSALWRMPAWVPGIDADLVSTLNSLNGWGDTFRSAGATDKAMNGSAISYGSSSAAGGRGGLGYGAGGGGAAHANDGTDTGSGRGGKAGTVKITAITLSSLNSITVTVGTGGAGGNYTAVGGAGANGCVAVFW